MSPDAPRAHHGPAVRPPLRSLRRVLLALTLAASTAGCASLSARGTGTAGAPDTFLRLGSERQTQRTFDVREGLTKAAAFKLVTDYLAEKQYELEARDQTAGFVMTGWQASLSRAGVPDLRYRTRIILKFVGEDWRQLQVRAEAGWRDGDEWQVGVDRSVLDQVSAVLQDRLGRR